MISVSTNLITQKLNSLRVSNPVNSQKNIPTKVEPSFGENLLISYLNNQAVMNAPAVQKTTPVKEVKAPEKPYKNDLRDLFLTNNAKILAIIPRTFNAKDKDGNEIIQGNEEHGTLKNAVDRLDEVKAEGFNTLHVLPINPPGASNAMGTAGSVYAPADMLKIDPVLLDKNDSRSDREQFKSFVDECHKRGLRVMVDMPSCASYDLYNAKPELMAHERNGLAKTPQGWFDIRMFQPWEDEGIRTLNPELLEYHRKFVDMMIDSGVDGIRADVARAKPVEFWDIIIPYSRKRDPEFAWLAETYTYEDASPQANMPYDRPEDSLRAGFDAYYGQYHIFNEWNTASQLHDYVIDNLNMSYRVEKGKSLIGSFATHDDISPMFHGGEVYCNLTSGLEVTLPMMNPYFVDGFQSGDWYSYDYRGKSSPETMTDNHDLTVHQGKLDIFNLSRKPGGDKPQIGKFMTECFKLRDNYNDVLTRGSYIVLDKKKDKLDQVIAFARHRQGRTLLVIANKNVNRDVACKVEVPSLKADQKLVNLLPSYGKESQFQVSQGEVSVNLGPGRIHVFEIDTPYIERYSKNVYKQH